MSRANCLIMQRHWTDLLLGMRGRELCQFQKMTIKCYCAMAEILYHRHSFLFSWLDPGSIPIPNPGSHADRRRRTWVVIIWRRGLPHFTNMATPPKIATDCHVNAVTLINLTFSGSPIFIACFLAAWIGKILVTPMLLYFFMTRGVFARPIVQPGDFNFKV